VSAADDDERRPRQGAAAVVGLVLVLAALAALTYFAFVQTGREEDVARPPTGVTATPTPVASPP
jgi:hypothetical protein